MKYKMEFVVEGRGAFPVDMLRYDRAFPATQEGANNITTGRPVTDETVRVHLCAFCESPACRPTNGRWASFGWRVQDFKVMKLAV